MAKHLLFLCSRNKLRSPTAEEIFRGRPGIEVDSAGLSNDAEVPLEPEQLAWADLILVMEPIHRTRLNRQFSKLLKGKRIVVLHIPDRFPFMDPGLIKELESRCAPHLA